MKYLSLFSGIGGFDLGFDRTGMECAGQVEIDPACNALLARYWPHVWRCNDVREVNAGNAPAVDLVCGGFPCQDVSVAGRRAGLAGERSGLWFEFERIIKDLLPPWIVIENVPGLLSSNGSADIQIILDSLAQIGYTVDVDIKDAQEFGVAQRRRRVFLSCARLDALLSKRTNLSRQISADLLVQTLLNIWGAIPQALSPVRLHWDYARPTERCAALLRKMTGLFEITRERLACKKYPSGLSVLLDQFGGAGSDLESETTSARGGIPPEENSSGTDTLSFELQAGSGGQNMMSLLNQLLVAACEMERPFTTSISTSLITDQTIYTFARTVLLIIGRILHSLDWSESCWSVAQSASMLLAENMNYARQASNFMFIEPGLRDCWRDYLGSASGIESELERRTGEIRAAQVLFEREGVPGDSPPRREAGKEVAGTIASSTGDSGEVVSFHSSGAGYYNASEQSRPLTERDWRDGGPGWIAHILSAESHDASEDGTGRGIPLVVGALQAHTTRHGHAMTTGQAAIDSGQILPLPTGVRRLTPTECERLQGFPDNFTAGQSDSARYRQLGNAVCVPVAEWLGRRIMREHGR